MEQYFAAKLNTLGLDGDILASYFVSHLRDEGEKAKEVLSMLLCDYGLDESTARSVVASCHQTFSRGYLVVEEEAALLPMPMTSMETPNCSFVDDLDGFLRQTPTQNDEQNIVITDLIEEVLAGEDDDDNAVLDLYTDAFGEYEDDEEVVDHVALIEQVDYALQTEYQCAFQYAPEAIYRALLSVDNDVYAACDQLVGASAALQSCKPCRHLMQGGCYRRDCMFEHGLEQYICRYWLVSHCANRENCLFSHDFLPAFDRAPKPPKYAAAAPEEEVSVPEEAFPVLPGKPRSATAFQFLPSKGYARAAQAKPAAPASSSFASARAAWSSKTMDAPFSSVAEVSGVPYSVRGGSGGAGGQGFAEMLKQLNFVYSGRSSEKAGTEDKTRDALRVKAGEWVASGDSLLAEYSALREHAKMLSSGRTRLFAEAANAYVCGSRDVARSLSQQAHSLSEQMQACQLEAGKSLFRRRNTVASLQAGNIDLHGLHVAEATSCLQDLLPLYQQMGMANIKIITGTGHHSTQGRARLLPAVQQLMKDLGYSTRPVKDSGGHSGALLVTLPLWR